MDIIIDKPYLNPGRIKRKKKRNARINGRQRLLWLLDNLLGHAVQTSRHTVDSAVAWKTECQARSSVCPGGSVSMSVKVSVKVQL